jgi:hypothetical protein
MNDIKFQIQPKTFDKFRAAVNQQFPHWRQRRLVQVATSGDVALIHPLNGYSLSQIEQMVIDEIIAEFEDVEMELAA